MLVGWIEWPKAYWLFGVESSGAKTVGMASSPGCVYDGI